MRTISASAFVLDSMLLFPYRYSFLQVKIHIYHEKPRNINKLWIILHYCIALFFYNKSMKSEKENEMGVAIGVDNEVIEKVLRRVAVGRDNSATGRVVGRRVRLRLR